MNKFDQIVNHIVDETFLAFIFIAKKSVSFTWTCLSIGEDSRTDFLPYKKINWFLQTFLINVCIIMLLLKYSIKTISDYRFWSQLLDILGLRGNQTSRLILEVGFDPHTHCILLMLLFNFRLLFHLLLWFVLINYVRINFLSKSDRREYRWEVAIANPSSLKLMIRRVRLKITMCRIVHGKTSIKKEIIRTFQISKTNPHLSVLQSNLLTNSITKKEEIKISNLNSFRIFQTKTF